MRDAIRAGRYYRGCGCAITPECEMNRRVVALHDVNACRISIGRPHSRPDHADSLEHGPLRLRADRRRIPLRGCGPARTPHVFGFDDVDARAKALADAAFQDAGSNLPGALQHLDHDRYEAIRFRPEAARWRAAKLPFEMQFFHEGWLFDRPVKIDEIARGSVNEIAFDAQAFDYAKSGIDPQAVDGVGYAGFNVHYALNLPTYKDDVLAFLGASYFRALGKGQLYGLSARGLAIDTALASGEEFPRFVEFWIEKPQARCGCADVLRSARFAARDRRLPLRVRARRRFGRRSDGAHLSARQGRQARHRAADQHVLSRLEPARGQRRLPARSARFRRSFDPVQERRMDLAPAGQSEAAAGHFVRAGQSARFRPDAAAARRSRSTRIFRRATKRIRARGSSRSANGAAAASSSCRFRRRTRPTTTSSRTGCPIASPAPKEPIDLHYRIHWQKDIETQPDVRVGRANAARQRLHAQARRRHRLRRRLQGADAARSVRPTRPWRRMFPPTPTARSSTRSSSRNPETGGVRLELHVRRIDETKPIELRAALRNGDEASETWSYALPPG